MNDFGSGEWIAIVTAIGAVIVNIIYAIKTDKKVGIIEHAVNSAAAASKAEINGLLAEIQLMRGVAAEKKEIASNLAQAAVRPPLENGPQSIQPLPQPLEVKIAGKKGDE